MLNGSGRLGDGGERPGSLLLSWLLGFLRPDERLRNHFVRASAYLPAACGLAHTVSCSSGALVVSPVLRVLPVQ
jgi:hypothetical protein